MQESPSEWIIPSWVRAGQSFVVDGSGVIHHIRAEVDGLFYIVKHNSVFTDGGIVGKGYFYKHQDSLIHLGPTDDAVAAKFVAWMKNIHGS